MEVWIRKINEYLLGGKVKKGTVCTEGSQLFGMVGSSRCDAFKRPRQ